MFRSSVFFSVIKLNLFFAFLLIYFTANTQQLSDEIRSKMNDSDQKKLSKTDAIQTKGELILSQSGYIGDKQLLGSVNDDSKEIKKQLSTRIQAAGYFKEVNATQYSIYTRYIQNFWKTFTGNKSALDNVKQKETAAIDSFEYAQKIRKESDKKSKLPERIPLVIYAEKIESNAIGDIQKVLITYFYYPAQYNAEWFEEKPVSPLTLDNKNTAIDGISANEPAIQTKQEEDLTYTPSSVDTKKTLTAPTFTNNDSSLYTAINVDEDQIDLFNKFLQKTYPDDYEKYIINFQELDYSNIEALKKMWYNYRFGFPSADTTQLYAENTTDIKDSTQQAIVQNIQQSETTPDGKYVNFAEKVQKAKSQQTGNTDSKTSETQDVITYTQPLPDTQDAITYTQPLPDKNNTTSKTNSTVNKGKKVIKPVEGTTDVELITGESNYAANYMHVSNENMPVGFLYRVQIAACRETIEPQILNSLYSGSETKVETYEDNWYKYSIGEYYSYGDARKVRDQIDVPGAFVVAYLNGKRIRITPSNLYGKQSSDYIIPANINPRFIEYKLQIAASKAPMSDLKLRSIYNGTRTIESKFDDGWHKYMLHAGNTLQIARSLVNEINMPEAFIVTYYENEKINLITAIRLTKNN